MSALNVPTTFSYASDGTDNITGVQNGATGGGGSGTGAYGGAISSSYSYGGTTGTGANQYAPTSSTDGQGNTTTVKYGSGTSGDYGAGEPTSITDQLSAQNQATLTYNANGTVATSTDPNGNQTIYSYTNGDLTGVMPPLDTLNPITITYDAANRVQSVSTIYGSTGHEVDYSYNPLDQITQEIYKNAAGTTVATITYSYDNDGNLISVTDGSGTSSYSYDGLGRLTDQTPAIGPASSYGYDAAGNLTGFHDPSGTTTYAYDKLNQVTSVTDPSQSKPIATFAYDADGNLTGTTYSSGASIANTYNNLDQLTKVNNTYKTSAGAAAHLSYSYAYTNGGLQRTVTDQTNSVTTYTYDVLSRLTEAKITNSSATTTADYQYTLDGDSNILRNAVTGSAVTPVTTSYAYDSGNQTCWSYTGVSSNACASPPIGAHQFSYDSEGNETSNGNGLSMTYNTLGQTASITANGATTNYTYQGDGQNQLAQEGSIALDNTLLGVTSSGTGSTASYYTRSEAGQLLDERTQAGVYNYLLDGGGDVVGLTDTAGHLVKQYAYDPYGHTTSSSGAIANPFGYLSGYQTVSGLYHFGARYLNPSSGSWTQEDPLNQATNLNQIDRYVYAGSNPIDQSDLNGQGPIADGNTAQQTSRYYGCRGAACNNAGFDQIFNAVASALTSCIAGTATGRAAQVAVSTVRSVVSATEVAVADLDPTTAAAACALNLARKYSR